MIVVLFPEVPWHSWFAWYPVRVVLTRGNDCSVNYGWAWFETVQRARHVQNMRYNYRVQVE